MDSFIDVDAMNYSDMNRKLCLGVFCVCASVFMYVYTLLLCFFMCLCIFFNLCYTIFHCSTLLIIMNCVICRENPKQLNVFQYELYNEDLEAVIIACNCSKDKYH